MSTLSSLIKVFTAFHIRKHFDIWILKIWQSHFVLKIEQFCFMMQQCVAKDADETANRLDPEQTAPLGGI